MTPIDRNAKRNFAEVSIAINSQASQYLPSDLLRTRDAITRLKIGTAMSPPIGSPAILIVVPKMNYER